MRSEQIYPISIRHYEYVKHFAARVTQDISKTCQSNSILIGLFALCDAAAGYKPQNKYSFEAYAYPKVRAAIKEYIELSHFDPKNVVNWLIHKDDFKIVNEEILTKSISHLQISKHYKDDLV